MSELNAPPLVPPNAISGREKSGPPPSLSAPAGASIVDAMALHNAGDIDAAAKAYRAILDEDAGNADALHLLGVVAQQKGNPALALKLIEAALAREPEYLQAWINRTIVLQTLGRHHDAFHSARSAIAIDKDNTAMWDSAATQLRHLGLYDEAVRHHRRAMLLQPGDLALKGNYAETLLASGKLREAYDVVRPYAEQDAASFAATDTRGAALPQVIGKILTVAGYPERAARFYFRAAEAAPDSPGAYVNAALALMKIGNYTDGLRLWQSRVDGLAARFKSIPEWQGDPVGHLLLYEDQGLGDALQCLRYVPLVRDRAQKITLQLAAPLVALAAASFPDCDVRSLDAAPQPADARARLMSLPHLCATTPYTIPDTVPYLRAPKDRQLSWSQSLRSKPEPRIGLVWGGNPAFPGDKTRSVPFAQLEPLLRHAKSHLVSLQLGRPLDDAALAASGIENLAPGIADFADTAAALMNLDLLITVDTSIAHLAGALGRPVWLMLPFDPDWRWMLERQDNLWYPHTRLFRQTVNGDWGNVILDVANAVEKFLSGDKTVLSPPVWSGPFAIQNSHALDLSANS